MCLSNPAGSYLPRNESAPLRGPSLPCFEGLCVMCMYVMHVCVCVRIIITASLERRMTPVSTLKKNTQTCIYSLCVHTLLCAHLKAHTCTFFAPKQKTAIPARPENRTDFRFHKQAHRAPKQSQGGGFNCFQMQVQDGVHTNTYRQNFLLC